MTEQQNILLGLLMLSTALAVGTHQVISIHSKNKAFLVARDAFYDFYTSNPGVHIPHSPLGRKLLIEFIEAKESILREYLAQQFWFMNEELIKELLHPLVTLLNEPPPTSPASRPRASRGAFVL